jgi:hypothetical protein
LYYAFVDESGDVAPFSGSHFLVVALFGMQQTRPIELHIKRALKSYGASLGSGEMKAAASREKVIERLLKAIADESVSIIATIVDKRAMIYPLGDPEALYRWAVAKTVRLVISKWSRVDICLDKRYTNKTLRYLLEREIRESIADVSQEVVIIRQEDSVANKLLQAVDYVAWAFFQKYERGDERFYQLIADRVIAEELVSYP